jgi:hypothetical protein
MVLGQTKRAAEAETQAPTLFARFARWVEYQVGRSSTFVLAIAVVLRWAVSGPVFGWSDTWQLVINTGTTITLMVFVIQNTQSRDTQVLDELIRVRPEDYGFYASLPPMGFLVGSFLSNRLTQRLGIDGLIAIGCLALVPAGSTMVTLALLGVTSPYAIIAPMILICCGSGLITRNATAGSLGSTLVLLALRLVWEALYKSPGLPERPQHFHSAQAAIRSCSPA